MLNDMFEQAVRASEAQKESAIGLQGTVVPALMGCLDCGTVAMIASPTLGSCTDCGAELTVLRADQV